MSQTPNQKNIVHGSITAGGNVHIGDNIQYSDYQVPRFLTQKPFQTNFFIGRDTDLAAIETEYLHNNHLLVLVNGEGGMGKTTLAAQYWFKHEARYKHLAWVFVDSGIGNALLSLAANLGIKFSLQDDEKMRIVRITEEVNNLDAPCLLVFDNANNTTDLEQYFVTLRRLSNCHILLTSRVTALEDVHVHRVLPLDKDFAVTVFKNYYKKYSDTEESLLNSLLNAIGYNTLVIEVLAKNLAVFNKFQTHYSLQSLVTDLQSRGLLALQNKTVKVVYQSDSLRIETPENIIAAMYDLSALSETERYLLSNFAVLPAENMPFDLFIELLKPDDVAALEDPLSSLQQKGWIEYFEHNHTFKMSPVIQSITQVKNRERLLNDCDTLIDTLIDKLYPDNIHDDNYKMSTIFSRYAETVMAAFDTPQYNVALLCERIGTYHTTIGNLDRAITFYEKFSEILKELCELNPSDENFKISLAISYEKLGETHTALGNLDKALVLYEGYNRLAKELYTAYPNNVEYKNDLAISYSNLAETHTALGNLDKALVFCEDAVKLFKELNVTYPNHVEYKNGLAGSYSNLGSTHRALGNLDKALGFHKKANQTIKELYTTYTNNIRFKNGLAISYTNLGMTHTTLGNLETALGFNEKSNQTRNELYAAYPNNVEFKSSLAGSYQYLGFTHMDLGNLDKALVFYGDYNRLEKELYAAYPNNVSFKNGLASSYCFLGITHTALGNLDKALEFYQDFNRLIKELYADYSNHVEYKNGLAISYEKLGETHTALGNLGKALGFYEEDMKLSKELYTAHPNYVEYKNGLAVSYSQLGLFCRDKKNDKAKARIYFEQCQTLWRELATSFPSYTEFQNNLKWVEDALKSLD